MQLYPSEIKYSQNSISSCFSNGRSIGETLDELCKGRISIGSFPRIKVFRSGRVWISENNRRLWVFKQLERLGKCGKIRVEAGQAPANWHQGSQEYDDVRIRGGDPGGSWYTRSPPGDGFLTKCASVAGVGLCFILVVLFAIAK